MVELVGWSVSAGVLYVLMGKKGITLITRDSSLTVGGAVIGSIVCVFIYTLLPNTFINDRSVRPLLCMMIVGAVTALTWIVELIRRRVDGE